MREIEYAANMVLPQWGVTCFYETFVHKQTTVLLLNICAKDPAHRKSAKRYRKVKNCLNVTRLHC